jgi:hypothetical protein
MLTHALVIRFGQDDRHRPAMPGQMHDFPFFHLVNQRGEGVFGFRDGRFQHDGDEKNLAIG